MKNGKMPMQVSERREESEMPELPLVEKQLCDMALQILRESEELQDVLFSLSQQNCEATLQVRVQVLPDSSKCVTSALSHPLTFQDLLNEDDQRLLADMGIS